MKRCCNYTESVVYGIVWMSVAESIVVIILSLLSMSLSG